MTCRSGVVGCAMALSGLLAGCWAGRSSTAGACPSVDPADREGPASFVGMTDGSYATQRYKNFSVYIPDNRAAVVAQTDNRWVLHRHGASLQPKGVFATA